MQDFFIPPPCILLTLLAMAEYFKIGKLAASTGLKGEMVLVHNLGKRTDFKGVKAMFLEEKNGNLLPYFLESSKIRSANETLIKLEGIVNVEMARKLTPSAVWITEQDFHQHKADTAPIALLGYEMMNGSESLGKILEVIEQPHQMLCTILYKGKEALVPVHADNLVKMDPKNKKLFVNIPEGLLDMYA